MKRFTVSVVLVVVAAAIGLTARRYLIGENRLSLPVTSVSKKGERTFANAACARTYAKFFSKGVVDIQVVFGYKDARPARFVDDRYEEMIFIQRILTPCQGYREDCGFQPTQAGASSDNVFAKALMGPEGNVKMIRLTVTHSSVSPDDDENRKNPFQKWQTGYAGAAFTNALKKADVVFYNGHSRSGGGPDFAPPTLDARGHVKYSLYKASGKSLLSMEDAIRGRNDSNLKVIGLFSCASDQLFTRRLSRARKGVGIISSQQLLYFSDALESSLVTLSALLEMKCRSGWSGLFETKTALSGFWLNESETAAKVR